MRLLRINPTVVWTHSIFRLFFSMRQLVTCDDFGNVGTLVSRYVFLLLEFSRPSPVDVALKFDLDKQSSLADGIVQARGVYLQPQESGARVVEGLDNPKILVEVPPKTKLPNWDNILLKRFNKKMKRKGMTGKQASIAAKVFLSRLREIWGFRMNT